MYLSMIQPENKNLFLKLAAMVSLADISERKEEKTEGSGLLYSSAFFAVANQARGAAGKLSEFINRKDEEKAALKLYAKEMGVDIKSSDIENLDDVVLNAIYKASETVSEKLFANIELRKQFFQDGLEELLRTEVQEDNVIPMTERKAMLFETTAMAYADGECSDLERAVLDKLAEQFDIDEEFIDEAGEIVESFKKVTQEGLELINE